MILSFKKTILAGVLLGTLTALAADPAKAENNFLFYGNSLVEKLMEGGDLEACLQLAHPDASVVVRSLAWTGDEVGIGYTFDDHLETLVSMLTEFGAPSALIANLRRDVTLAGRKFA